MHRTLVLLTWWSLGVVLGGGLNGCASGPRLPDVRPAAPPSMEWASLPTLIDPLGFAGGYAGVSGDALLHAGGANFPDGRPWDGASKVWHDRIGVLTDDGATWQWSDEALPKPAAYGVSATWDDAMVCVGGGDAEAHFADAFMVRWVDGACTVEELPPLPQETAFCSGALVGSVLYVAGGRATPTAPAALHAAWSLDLAVAPEERAWATLPPWPGPERMLAVAASWQESFVLMSGVRLAAGDDASVQRESLRDAYAYQPSTGWRRLPDLPYAATAAPSPACTSPDGALVVLGGDDGALLHVEDLRDEHPGFPGRILTLDVDATRWQEEGHLPRDFGPDPFHRPYVGTWPPVTAPTAMWHGRHVVVSGEVRPGVRTPKVHAVRWLD